MDKARKQTDKKLRQMEREITKQYRKSAKGIAKSWNAYFKEANKEIQSYETALATAKKHGDKKGIERAEKDLKQAKENLTLYSQRYSDMIQETARNLATSNEKALSYVNGNMPEVYTMNYNYTEKIVENMDVDFSAVSESVVARRFKDGEIVPRKRLSVPKDMRWNAKQMNSAVLQGILQGESMDKIAKRLQPIIGNNKESAIRNARTMVTQAENVGRLDGYKQLQDKGAILKKIWIATGDKRTRAWHDSMDGQEQDIDEPFIDGNGNKLMYPADPDGAPETIYNCRCSMATRVVGIRKADGRIEYIDDEDKPKAEA